MATGPCLTADSLILLKFEFIQTCILLGYYSALILIMNAQYAAA